MKMNKRLKKKKKRNCSTTTSPTTCALPAQRGIDQSLQTRERERERECVCLYCYFFEHSKNHKNKKSSLLCIVSLSSLAHSPSQLHHLRFFFFIVNGLIFSSLMLSLSLSLCLCIVGRFSRSGFCKGRLTKALRIFQGFGGSVFLLLVDE